MIVALATNGARADLVPVLTVDPACRVAMSL